MTREEDLIDAILFHDRKRIDELLKFKELNINYTQGELGEGGSSILTIASATGQIETVRKLIKRGANVNCNNCYSSETPLQAAVRSGSKAIVELLLEHGADIRVPCAYPGSLLIEAAWRGYFSIAEILIARGANIHFVNKYDTTALDTAFEYGQPKLITLLSNLKAKRNSNKILDKYRAAVLELLLGRDVNVNQKFVYYGQVKLSFLTFAVQLGHWKIARILHSKGAKHHSDNSEMTLLHYSTLKGSVHTVRWVLSIPEYRSAINQFTTPTLGSTPLGLACEQGFDHTVRFLAENGASLELMNSSRESPLSKAYKHPRTKTVQLLIDLGANPNLIKPYSRSMDDFHIDFHEKCLIVQSCLDNRTLKLLASFVAVEYFKNTNDCLLSKHEKLLEHLIKKFAEHAAKLIAHHNIVSITEKLLRMIETSKKTFEDDNVKAEFMQKQLRECRGMIVQSLINRLTTILCKPPGYFIQSYLNYQLHPGRPLTLSICTNSMDQNPFFSHVHSTLEDVFTGLELFGYKLNEFDCSLHFNFERKPAKATIQNQDSTENILSLTSTSGGEVGSGGDVKEANEGVELFIKGILKVYTELHENRLELSNRIMQKYRSAVLRAATSTEASMLSDVKSHVELNTSQMTQMSLVPVREPVPQELNPLQFETKRQREASLLVSDPRITNDISLNAISMNSQYQAIGQIMGQVFHLLETEQNNEHRDTIHPLLQQVSQNVSQATLLKTAQLLLEKIYIRNTSIRSQTRVASPVLQEPDSAPRLLTPQLDLQQSRNQEARDKAQETNSSVVVAVGVRSKQATSNA